MRKVNIHEAKSSLSKLVEAAEAGEEIVLARAGRPVARITRLVTESGIRFGTAKGFVKAIDSGFDRPLTKKQREALLGGRVEP
jgi:antitoxin (DNA-binding transcriptional repressor) of toxin-antitoxin stability system